MNPNGNYGTKYIYDDNKINKYTYNINNNDINKINDIFKKYNNIKTGDMFITDYGKIIDNLSLSDLKSLRMDLVSLTSQRTNSIQPSVNTVMPQPTPRPAVSAEPTINVEQENKERIEGFLNEMFNVSQSRDFRGWILPNGKLMSQFSLDKTVYSRNNRQDHGKLIKLFINGLEYYNKDLYDKIMNAFENYQLQGYGQIISTQDIHESFAVEVLGWMQVSYQGGRYIVAQKDADWQYKYLLPFVTDFLFSIRERPNMGYINLRDTYDSITEIIKLGLEAQEKSTGFRI